MVGFHKPATLAEALALLADEDARPLSGGQTLVPMLNQGVVQPSLIVSLGRLRELRGITRLAGGAVRIGAMATHAEIATSTLFEAGQTLMPRTAVQIADPAVRAAGTIGGSCAFGDPTADWPVTLCACGALIELASAAGRREVPATDFFQHYLQTELQTGELVTAVTIPPLAGRGVYRKFARVYGDNATVSVAVILDVDVDVAVEAGRCRFVRLAVGSVGPRPIRLTAVEDSLVGRMLDAAAAEAAGAALAAEADPLDDLRGSAAYKRRILPRLVQRTLLEGINP